MTTRTLLEDLLDLDRRMGMGGGGEEIGDPAVDPIPGYNETDDLTQQEREGAPVVGFELSDHDLRCLEGIRDGQADTPSDTLSWLRECGLVADSGGLTELGVAVLG